MLASHTRIFLRFLTFTGRVIFALYRRLCCPCPPFSCCLMMWQAACCPQEWFPQQLHVQYLHGVVLSPLYPLLPLLMASAVNSGRTPAHTHSLANFTITLPSRNMEAVLVSPRAATSAHPWCFKSQAFTIVLITGARVPFCMVTMNMLAFASHRPAIDCNVILKLWTWTWTSCPRTGESVYVFVLR